MVLLSSGAVSVSRYFLGNPGFYISSALVFLIVCYGAVCLGRVKAAEHSELIIAGKSGRVTYCKLKDGFKGSDRDIAKFPEKFVQTFEKVTNENRVVKIIETTESIYLFFVPESGKIPKNYSGESINIQKTDLLYCRVSGTQSGSLRFQGKFDCFPLLDANCPIQSGYRSIAQPTRTGERAIDR